MKRIGYIFTRIYSMENLKLAHKNARKDKLFYQEVVMIDSDPEYYLAQIQEMLMTGTRGVDFVGYRFSYGFKLLRKTTCNRFKRTMVKIRSKAEKGHRINYREWCSANFYKGWLKWYDGFRLAEKYIKPIQWGIDDYYNNAIKRKAAVT